MCFVSSVYLRRSSPVFLWLLRAFVPKLCFGSCLKGLFAAQPQRVRGYCPYSFYLWHYSSCQWATGRSLGSPLHFYFWHYSSYQLGMSTARAYFLQTGSSFQSG